MNNLIKRNFPLDDKPIEYIWTIHLNNIRNTIKDDRTFMQTLELLIDGYYLDYKDLLWARHGDYLGLGCARSLDNCRAMRKDFSEFVRLVYFNEITKAA